MTTKMISEETLQPQAQEETRITPRDLHRVFWRSFQMEFSWNYERQMNLAFVYALIPVLKKLYPRKEELAGALKRHLVFFNTTLRGSRINHVGIYLKDHKFIHTSTSRGVMVSSLDEDFFQKAWVCGGRVKYYK